jgi:N-methylhydantoinase A
MGLLDPATFANGEVPLDRSRAEAAVSERVAGPLGIDLAAAIVGVYQIATNQIAEAIRTVTVERGSDPRDYALVAFGGGGPLHAAAVARELGVGQIIVPRHPGLFSARGIATADFSHDYIQSVVRPITEVSASDVKSTFAALERQAAGDLDAESVADNRRAMTPALDLRYLGQTTEITVPLPVTADSLSDGFSQIVEQFHVLHERLYTYSVPDEPVELVNVRLRAVGSVDKPPLPPTDGAGAAPEPVGERPVLLPDGAQPVAVYRRDQLAPGATLAGAAIVEEPASTTLVLTGMDVSVDAYENMIIALRLPGQTP